MSIMKSAERTEVFERHESQEFNTDLSIAAGWYGIVERLTTQIEVLAPDFVINQVKEKFGDLRYYASNYGDDEHIQECIHLLIEKAEHEASITCECCGTQKAVKRKNMSWGWVVTLCTECRSALEQEREDDTS